MAKADELKAKMGLSGPPLRQLRSDPPAIPDHELIRCIGYGSYGEVWLARNVVGTWRAVKVVYRDDFKDERPYEREFSGIRKYEPFSRSNDGLVDVLQIGRNDAEGYFYYVMELADDADGANAECGVRSAESAGASANQQPLLASAASYQPRTLSADLRQRGRLPFEECLQLGLTLNLALGHLHRQGLIHRDVKPSNIIFVNGVPKLADIGLVTEIDEANTFVGTEGFIPPEGPNSPQADLYALGKVLYEASMGKDRKDFPEPFTRLTLDAESKALMELNAVLLKACATDPKGRYQSAEEMNADLALLYSGKSVTRHHATERRLAMLKRASLIGTAITVLAAAAFFYQSHETRVVKKLAGDNARLAQTSERAAAESRKQTVQLQVANGMRLMERGLCFYHDEEGDLASSLSWFAEALRNLKDDPEREQVHRARIGSLLENYPKLQHLFVHDAPVYLCVFSPDGQRLASLSRALSGDAKLNLFDLTFEKLLWQVALTNIPIVYDSRSSLFFSRDSRRVVLRAAAQEIQTAVYDASDGHRIELPAQLAAQNRLLDTADGETALVLNGDSAAQVVDLDSGRRLSPLLESADKVVSGRLSDGNQFVVLLTGNPAAPESAGSAMPASTNALQVWTVSTGRPIGPSVAVAAEAQYRLTRDGYRLFVTAPGPQGPSYRVVRNFDVATGKETVLEAKLSEQFDSFVSGPDGQWVITRREQEGVQTLWNVDTGQTATINHVNPSGWHGHAFSPDGLLVTTDDKVWNMADGKTISPPRKHASWVRGIAFSPDGRSIATASDDRTLRVSDIATCPVPALTIRTHDRIPDAAFSPDGNKIVTLTTWASSGRLWDAHSGKPLGPGLVDGIGLSDVVFSPDGSGLAAYAGGRRKDRVLSNSRMSGALVWQVGTCSNVLWLHTNAVVDAAEFSPDSKRLLTAGDDKLARVWNATTGEPLLTLKHQMEVFSAAFSPEGSQIVTSESLGAVRLWNAGTGELIYEIKDPAIGFQTVAFSQDGQQIAIGGNDQSARVWSLRTKSFVTPPLFHAGYPNELRFSPDGRLLLTFGPANIVKVWDVAAGDLALPMLSHKKLEMVAAQFSPNGRLIISGCADGTARVWDTATGEPVCIPIKHAGGVYAAKFDPAGDRFLTAGHDNVAKVWRIKRCDYSAEEICQLAELFSCGRLDRTGTFLPLRIEEIAQRFIQLRAAHPELFQSDRRAQAAWHEQMAYLAKENRNWTSVIWHLDHAFQLDPELAKSPSADELFDRRACAHAELGHWAAAVADYERAVQIDPDKINNWWELCYALLASGQIDKYASTCAEMLRHYQWATTISGLPGWTRTWVLAQVGALTPNGPLPERLVELSAAALSSTPDSPALLSSHGRALYRAGRFKEACENIERSLRSAEKSPDDPDWDDLLFLAMAQHRAGRATEARETHAKALASWERRSKKAESKPADGPDWMDRASFQFLRREANAVLAGKTD